MARYATSARKSRTRRLRRGAQTIALTSSSVTVPLPQCGRRECPGKRFAKPGCRTHAGAATCLICRRHHWLSRREAIAEGER